MEFVTRSKKIVEPCPELDDTNNARAIGVFHQKGMVVAGRRRTLMYWPNVEMIGLPFGDWENHSHE